MTMVSELMYKWSREIPEVYQGEPLLINRERRRYTGFVRTIVLCMINLYYIRKEMRNG
jgi:hypothetical protein